MKSNQNDVAALKAQAAGRWAEILSALAGVPREILDGKNHPCPKPGCGGVDRFRFTNNGDNGSCYCNQCPDGKCGDGLAALMWLRGCDFRTALAEVYKYLGGVAEDSPSRSAKATRTEKPDEKDPTGQTEPVSPLNVDVLLGMYAKAKPPITPEGVTKCGGEVVRWPAKKANQFRCIQLCGHPKIGIDEVTAVVLVRVEGTTFPAMGDLGERKSHSTRGSHNSWLHSGTAEDVLQAKVILAVEGIPDLLATVSVGLPPGWVAVTNSAGGEARGSASLSWEHTEGKHVIVVGDADTTGVNGQKKDAAAYHHAGDAEVLLAQLPYEVIESHGKDLRDWLIENPGKTAADLPTVPVTQEQADDWGQPEEPVATRYVVSDCTVEALADLLSHQPRGLLVARDELSGWVNSFDAYKSARGADVAHWLSMHRGGSLTVDRKSGRRLIHVPRASICIAGGVQPKALAAALVGRYRPHDGAEQAMAKPDREHFDNGLANETLENAEDTGVSLPDPDSPENRKNTPPGNTTGKIPEKTGVVLPLPPNNECKTQFCPDVTETAAETQVEEVVEWTA